MVLLLVIALIIFLIAFLIITSKGEADLTLLFYERFGKRLDTLKGKVVWITGASSGIGEALAYVLAEHKVKLVLSSRNKSALERVKKNCLEMINDCLEQDILVLPFDLADYATHKGCLENVLKYFGQLDILVNNAGRSQRASFEDIDIEVHEQLFRCNTFGPVNLTTVVLPYFLKNKCGHFVVTSSTAGILGAPFSASYTGSKHALHGFFECLRVEKIGQNISVTMICPGPVESKIVENCCTGKLGENYQYDTDASRKVVKSERCARLMAYAIANKLDHVWISNQPVLFLHYVAQYTPSFFRNVFIKIISKDKADQLRNGKKQ